MRILIVEDDTSIREMLVRNLKTESFAVDSTDDGEHGSFLARTSEYDLIILDCVLPKKDGPTICAELRASGKTVPILIISARVSVADKVTLLNLGADDYITKPFSYDELVARVRALKRRPLRQESVNIHIGNLKIDSLTQEVWLSQKPIYLTRKEFALLEYFARHHGEVVSRGMIMEHVWDRESDPFSKTIEAHVFNLRRKLSSRRRSCIQTIPGRGYKLALHH